VDETRQPWERLSDESDRAWAAFQTYRDLGPGNRSYNRAYQLRYGKPPNRVAPEFFHRWGREHHWVERATAWDKHLDAINRQAREDEAARWRQRRRELLAGYFAKLAQALDVATWIETPLTAQVQNPDKPRLKDGVHLRDITAAVNMIAGQLRQEYDDLPTQRVEQMATIVEDTLDRWASMTDDELDHVIANLQILSGLPVAKPTEGDAELTD
jgi:hypothetical protein